MGNIQGAPRAPSPTLDEDPPTLGALLAAPGAVRRAHFAAVHASPKTYSGADIARICEKAIRYPELIPLFRSYGFDIDQIAWPKEGVPRFTALVLLANGHDFPPTPALERMSPDARKVFDEIDAYARSRGVTKAGAVDALLTNCGRCGWPAANAGEGGYQCADCAAAAAE